MSERPAAALPPSIARTVLDEIRTTVTDDERARFATMLVSARTRSGRSIEDLARATKISPRYLVALEEGRIEQLPAGVYRRAIVRDYAAAVGLEPSVAFEQLVATFVAVAPAAAADPDPVRVERTAPRRAWRATLPATLPAIGIAFTPSLPSLALGVVLGVALATIIATSGLGYGGLAPADSPPADVGMAAATSAAAAAVTGMSGSAARGDVALPAAPAPELLPADAPTRLVVTTSPAGARVTVDGIGWGVTPLTIRHLPPGEKIVRVTKDGYVSREQRVRVAGSAALRLTLRPRG